MVDQPVNRSNDSSSRLLDPIARISEILFGLIMVLTFTGSISVSTASHEDTHEMLIGAIGCNLAWGIVDAVMYLMNNLTTRAHGRATLRSVRSAADPRHAHRAITESLPPIMAAILSESELESLRQRLNAIPEQSRGPMIGRDDWMGALGVFILVFLTTFPVVLPFIFMSQATLALRISNGIAIVMLFACGFSLGRFAGYKPWLVGLAMVLIGTTLAGMTLALGG